MATRPVVPRANGEGSIGTATKHWGAGHFDTLPNWQEYLAESTGYGIVSGCEPSISGLTVTVGAGVVHLADGTRKEIAETNITLDSADPSNPRIDLVYITSMGDIAKITGTAAGSPSVPALPTGGISVCNVTIAAGASTGKIADKRCFAFDPTDIVEYLFPKTSYHTQANIQGDCQIVRAQKTLMIDSGRVEEQQYLLDFLQKHNIDKVDYFLLTHYHDDHYGNLSVFLTLPQFQNTLFFIPVLNNSSTRPQTVKNILDNAGANYEILNHDKIIYLSDTCEVKFFCCEDSLRDYNEDNNYLDDNYYSIQALVRHGAVKVLYTGDGEHMEEYIMNNYDVEKVNLLKMPHHGVPSGILNSQYYQRLSPDITVFNANPLNTSTSNSIIEFVCASTGSKMVNIIYDDAILVSDRENLINLSKIFEWTSNKTGSGVYKIYVDAAYDGADTPNGSKEKPWPEVDCALKHLPPFSEYLEIEIHVANGTYGDVNIYNQRVSMVVDTATFGNITVSRAGRFYLAVTGNVKCSTLTISSSIFDIASDFSANKVYIYQSKGSFSNLYIAPTNSSVAVEVYNSEIRTRGYFWLKGQGSSSTNEECAYLINSRCTFDNLVLKDCGQAVVLKATSLYSRVCTAENVNKMIIFGDYGGEFSSQSVNTTNVNQKYVNFINGTVKTPDTSQDISSTNSGYIYLAPNLVLAYGYISYSEIPDSKTGSVVLPVQGGKIIGSVHCSFNQPGDNSSKYQIMTNISGRGFDYTVQVKWSFGWLCLVRI